VPQRIHATPLAIQLSWSLTTCCGLATTYIAHLINPHQIRANGYGICDDPWDPHRPLGIDLESMFIPLTVSGSNLSFESRVPTDWAMSNSPILNITLTTWNPADMHRSAPRLNPMHHVVDCTSTAWWDMWSPLTASQMAIFPTSDSRCVSSLYANAILVHDALTGTHGGISGISATFTSERATLECNV
jgi:hypothetical protein